MMRVLHLKTVEILSAKLCHDLLGPTTGILAGLEMLHETTANPDVFDLIKKGVDRLVSKLCLYRALCGKSGSILSLKEIQKLFADFLAHSPIQLQWVDISHFPLANEWGRLMGVCLFWIVECLPKGGTIAIQLHEDHMTINVTATHLTFKQEHLDILLNPTFDGDLHPSHFLPLLLKELVVHTNTTIHMTEKNKEHAMIKIFGDFKEKIPT